MLEIIIKLNILFYICSVEPLILAKKKCAVEACKNVALPCMSTCIRHVLLCEKQMLFEQCRVRDSNSFQCDRPVLNIKYHYPVCSVHSKPDFVSLVLLFSMFIWVLVEVCCILINYHILIQRREGT